MKNSINDLKSCLCPPGNGVYTIHTAQDKKDVLFKAIYNTTEPKEVQDKWEESLGNINEKVAILGIPSDAGAGIIRGSNWGPLFIRQNITDLKDSFQDLGDVRVIPHFHLDHILNEETKKSCRKALYDNEESHLPVSALGISEYTARTLYSNKPNLKILGLGGDHSVSYPLSKTWIENQKKLNKRFGLVHFDAHTDLLDARLGVDICFGSWTYHILDDLQDTKDLVQIGIRSSGKERNHWEKKFDIHQYWNYEVSEIGAEKFIQNIINEYKSKGIENLYISFDIDCLDMKYASATGTPEEGGLTPDDCSLMIERLGENFKVTGADLVEVAPFVHQNNGINEPETTLNSASLIFKSLLKAMNQK